METISDNGRTIIRLNPLYDSVSYGSVYNFTNIITEDSNSGYQFFSSVYGQDNVSSARGNSNFLKCLHTIESGFPLLIADGAAFGFYIEDIMPYVKGGTVSLIILESFEYAILKSGIFNSQLRGIDIEQPVVDAVLFFTWERYYTDLLESITKDKIYSYSKSSLNKTYCTPSNVESILSVYGLALRDTQSTSYFN